MTATMMKDNMKTKPKLELISGNDGLNAGILNISSGGKGTSSLADALIRSAILSEAPNLTEDEILLVMEEVKKELTQS